MEPKSCIMWSDFWKAKNDYIRILYLDVRDPLNQFFGELYDRALKEDARLTPEDNNKHTLSHFQSELQKLQKDVDPRIVDSIKSQLKCTFKDELVNAIFLMQFRWMVVKPEMHRQIEIKLPDFDRILVGLIKELSVEFYRYPYLFIDDRLDNQIGRVCVQEQINRRRELIQTVVYDVILAAMPMDKLFQLLCQDLSTDTAEEPTGDGAPKRKRRVRNEEKPTTKTKPGPDALGGETNRDTEGDDTAAASTPSNAAGGSLTLDSIPNLNAETVTPVAQHKPSELEEIDLLSANGLDTVNVSYERTSLQPPAHDQEQFNLLN